MPEPLIVDAHQDLAWNILTFGRDYTLSAAEIRASEQGTIAPRENGDTLLGWTEYQRGGVAVIFSTLFAAPFRRKLGDWDNQCYDGYDQAHAIYRAQLDAYHRLVDEHPAHFRLVEKLADLEAVVAHWQRTDTFEHPVGLVVLMENAEGVREPAELEEWWKGGVRIIGPAWAGTRYCGGTGEPGALTQDGYALLKRMVEYGFTLDISHMDEKAALQALDFYQGRVIASHANAATLVKKPDSNRHLTDSVIRRLVERDGIIGIIPANNFLLMDWKELGGRGSVTLDYVVAQMDYICQIAGDARHVGWGSDFDGGFGMQSVPAGIDTIADLRKITPLLAHQGYTAEDVAGILGENWLTYLRNLLPEAL